MTFEFNSDNLPSLFESVKQTSLLPEDTTSRSQSLYRKWRSQTFSELLGQEAITRTLQNAIAGGRVGHAYLFCGPRGTGKTSSARLLAKALNCTFNDVRARPCNKCDACLAIAEGRAMDLIEIDAASNRGIDEIRSLRDTIGYQPSQFRYKFYIIDEVHMLTEPAFNALLKTLEEPPPHAVFVLATTDPQDIPATVVSRCQRFDFQRISLEVITTRLAFICKQETLTFEPGALEMVARQATGSLRDALSLLDQLIVFSGGDITVDGVRAMLGVMNSEAVAEFINHLIEHDMSAGLELINRLVQSGTDLKRFNREVVDHLRAVMLVKANPNSNELVDMTREAVQNLHEQASRLDLKEVIELLKIFSQVDYNLKVSPYGQLPLEIAFMEAVLKPNGVVQPVSEPLRNPLKPVENKSSQPQASRPVPPSSPSPLRTLKPENPISENTVPVQINPASKKASSLETISEIPTKDAAVSPLLNKVKQESENPLPSTPQFTAPVKASPVIEEPTTKSIPPEDQVIAAVLELVEVQSAWLKVLKAVGIRKKMTEALLREARPIATEGNKIVVAFKWDFHHKQISADLNRRMLEEIYSEIVGQQVLIRCVMEKEGQSDGNNSGNGSGETSGGGGRPVNPGGGSVSELNDRQARERRAAQMFNARILE